MRTWMTAIPMVLFAAACAPLPGDLNDKLETASHHVAAPVPGEARPSDCPLTATVDHSAIEFQRCYAPEMRTGQNGAVALVLTGTFDERPGVSDTGVTLGVHLELDPTAVEGFETPTTLVIDGSTSIPTLSGSTYLSEDGITTTAHAAQSAAVRRVWVAAECFCYNYGAEQAFNGTAEVRFDRATRRLHGTLHLNLQGPIARYGTGASPPPAERSAVFDGTFDVPLP